MPQPSVKVMKRRSVEGFQPVALYSMEWPRFLNLG
jgi:hypothetical protein